MLWGSASRHGLLDTVKKHMACIFRRANGLFTLLFLLTILSLLLVAVSTWRYFSRENTKTDSGQTHGHFCACYA